MRSESMTAQLYSATNLLTGVHGWSDCSDEFFANMMICLINQASYLLWKQMKRLEEDFINEGGFTERLYNVRKAAKDR